MHRSALVAVVAATLSTGAALAVTEHTVDTGSTVADAVRAVSERLQPPTALRSTRRPIDSKGRPVIIKVPGQTKPSGDLEPKNAP